MEQWLRAYLKKFEGQSITTEQWKDFLYSYFNDKVSKIPPVAVCANFECRVTTRTINTYSRFSKQLYKKPTWVIYIEAQGCIILIWLFKVLFVSFCLKWCYVFIQASSSSHHLFIICIFTISLKRQWHQKPAGFLLSGHLLLLWNCTF